MSSRTTLPSPGRLVLGFAGIDEGSTPLVGGKAENLGRMSRSQLPVPPGFCVTTEAYRSAVGDALEAVLAELGVAPAGDDPTGSSTLAALAARARAAVLAVRMPPLVAEAVTEAYRALGDDVPVAVRSSATAEDLPAASFAGQQDTYLNVVGADDVLDAVHRCWASLWTDRAVTYRVAAGVDHRDVSLAVVVQQMVAATVAGVMFTANPVTGARHETVVDAAPGLGESVVSGAVNPDHFVVTSASGDVVERRLGDKRMVIEARAGGGTIRRELDDGAGSACLSDDRLRELVALGRRVTASYGAPQDTEWALDSSGTFWLTQARPITTLYPLPGGDGDPNGASGGPGLRVFFCFSLAQGLTRPLTPMGLSTVRPIGSGVTRLLGSPQADPLAGSRSTR
jgi:pyruvate,water dikinase